MFKIRLLLAPILYLSLSGPALALPFTYNFGFYNDIGGYSGGGAFTIDTLTGPPGLTAFAYSGTCGPLLPTCSFGITDVFSNSFDVMSGGHINSLDIFAWVETTGPGIGYGVRIDDLELSVGVCDVFGGNACFRIAALGQVSCFDCAYLDNPPANPPTVPVPPTLLLFGLGMVGVYLSLRKRPAQG